MPEGSSKCAKMGLQDEFIVMQDTCVESVHNFFFFIICILREVFEDLSHCTF